MLQFKPRDKCPTGNGYVYRVLEEVDMVLKEGMVFETILHRFWERIGFNDYLDKIIAMAPEGWCSSTVGSMHIIVHKVADGNVGYDYYYVCPPTQGHGRFQLDEKRRECSEERFRELISDPTVRLKENA